MNSKQRQKTTSRPGSKELIQGIGHVSGLNFSDKTQSLSTVLMLLGNKNKKEFFKEWENPSTQL